MYPYFPPQIKYPRDCSTLSYLLETCNDMIVYLFAVGGGGFADFHSAFSSKPEEQQAVGGGKIDFCLGRVDGGVGGREGGCVC